MNRFLAELGAAAVVIAAFVGVQLFGAPGGGLGSQPSPEATPTHVPTTSPESIPPPLTPSFTSSVHGYLSLIHI